MPGLARVFQHEDFSCTSCAASIIPRDHVNSAIDYRFVLIPRENNYLLSCLVDAWYKLKKRLETSQYFVIMFPVY